MTITGQPEAQKLTGSLGFLVNGLARLMKNALEQRLQNRGISATSWTLLTALGEEDRQPQTELSRRTFLDGATVTHVLDVMEAKGYIERNRDDLDRRVRLVTLTPAGRKVYGETASLGAVVNDEATVDLDQEDREWLEGVLRMIIEKMQGLQNAAG
jgi:MarR family transcriptional regulator for hemolysin